MARRVLTTEVKNSVFLLVKITASAEVIRWNAKSINILSTTVANANVLWIPGLFGSVLFSLCPEFVNHRYKPKEASKKFPDLQTRNTSKTLEMLIVAYGKSTLSRKNVFMWLIKLFKESREDVSDDARL